LRRGKAGTISRFKKIFSFSKLHEEVSLMDIVDLRSDTVTQPTGEMWAAMARAEVGDDVYGEDPTVNRLQEMAAARMGKEAALFVPSGTMGNLAAILAHCGRGEEIILGDGSHIFLNEAGGAAALGGVTPRTVKNQADGTLDLADVLEAIREEDQHHPVSRLVALENTHNHCGGVALTVDYTRAAGELAHAHGLILHLDGARIFNAAVVLGVEAAELAAPADSVTFCLSKGLCAPVGSVLCGSHSFIERAHRMRKQLGGGMRQAGVLAAAGIVALEVMVDRLGVDHMRARLLEEGLAHIPGLEVARKPLQTNMVFVSLAGEVPVDAIQLEAMLADRGVKVDVVALRGLRLVTHYWIDDAGIDRTVEAFEGVLEKHMI
jgi:threonine aldolase